MDREQRELQSLGFFGILAKSLEIISTSNDIFLRLSLTLILPFSLTCFAYIEFFYLRSPIVTASHMNALDVDSRFLEDQSSTEAVFAVICAIFYVLSIPSVAHVVACIYSGKKATMTQAIMDVVPKVWTRLVVNLLFAATPTSILDSVFKSINPTIVSSFNFRPGDRSYIVLSATLYTLHTLGDYYLRAIWQLVGVVSVLVEGIGFPVMRQSKRLMESKMGISLAIYMVKRLCSKLGPQLYKIIGNEANRLNSFKKKKANRLNVGFFAKVGLSLAISLLHCFLLLLPLVIDAIFYLVCKSRQCESDDNI